MNVATVAFLILHRSKSIFEKLHQFQEKSTELKANLQQEYKTKSSGTSRRKWKALSENLPSSLEKIWDIIANLGRQWDVTFIYWLPAQTTNTSF